MQEFFPLFLYKLLIKYYIQITPVNNKFDEILHFLAPNPELTNFNVRIPVVILCLA